MAEFPKTFGLRAYPGQTFMIHASASLVSDIQGVLLYVFIKDVTRQWEGLTGGAWAAFTKATPEELRREIVR